MKFITTTLSLLLLSFSVFSQTTRIVRPGQYNVPITEVQFNHNGSTYTQTSEASGVIASTNKAVTLNYVKINDNGTTKTLNNFNSLGAAITNNNFSGSVSGVGVYNKGAPVYANSQATWADAMIESGSDDNILNYLFYDHSSNVPSGSDFDILWTKGWESNDFMMVGERNGNTCFALTPLDSTGAVITSAFKLQFGNCYGSVRAEYDWNIGYAPSNYGSQPMVFTVINIAAFNTDRTIYGFRIDNTGDADPKFFGLSDVTFNDNPNNPLIGGISGNVFNDGNGLVNSTVDGDGIQRPSNTPLYASLLNSSGDVIETTAIDADGYYEFLNLDPDTYSVVVSTVEGTIGNSAPNVVLPSKWENTGENIGKSAGSDGTADGIISRITINNNFIENANFGINMTPESYDKRTRIALPSLGSVQALIASNRFPALQGSDFEDGDLGTTYALVVTDTSSMNGNELYYDGNRFPLNTAIPNFDPSLLAVKFIGLNSRTFAFDYYFEDNAAAADESPATYEAGWSEPLPVEWLDFNIKLTSNQEVIVQWSTAQEENNSHFIVLRADSKGDFIEVGSLQGKGTYAGISEYTLTDASITIGQTYYYKVKQVDFDGKSSETNVLAVDVTLKATRINVYPNPFVGSVEIDLNKVKFEQIVVKDLTGKVMFQTSASISKTPFVTINTIEWPTGVYFLTVLNGDSQVTKKIIRH